MIAIFRKSLTCIDFWLVHKIAILSRRLQNYLSIYLTIFFLIFFPSGKVICFRYIFSKLTNISLIILTIGSYKSNFKVGLTLCIPYNQLTYPTKQNISICSDSYSWLNIKQTSLARPDNIAGLTPILVDLIVVFTRAMSTLHQKCDLIVFATGRQSQHFAAELTYKLTKVFRLLQ